MYESSYRGVTGDGNARDLTTKATRVNEHGQLDFLAHLAYFVVSVR